MLSSEETNYEVCFIVSTERGTGQITLVGPDRRFYGDSSDEVMFKVRAGSEEEAGEKGYKMLTDPTGEYVKKYGPAFEVKKKYIWQIY